MSGGLVWGDYAVSMSMGSATGEYSTAMNMGSALGGYSIAISHGYTWANNSFAHGQGSRAFAYQSFVLGRNNAATGSEDAEAWIETDPLFIVGNGTGNSSDPPEVRERNAFTIYKNGNVIIPKRQGDIPMGEFGNPE